MSLCIIIKRYTKRRGYMPIIERANEVVDKHVTTLEVIKIIDKAFMSLVEVLAHLPAKKRNEIMCIAYDVLSERVRRNNVKL